MQLTQPEILHAIAQIEQLFPAPRTLSRALHLLRNPQSDLGEVAALINRDPALTADVLRCANSVLYRRGEPVSAIDEAVRKIGFQETIRLLNLVVAQQAAQHDLDCYGIAAEDFWAESLFSGLFLEHLAGATGAIDAGEAYTAGLLRFIGRLAINQAIRNLGGGLSWSPGTPVAEWENAHVGLTQGTAGAVLLCNWKFPDAISDAVEAQDEETLEPDATPLMQAMHFTAQLLPAGIDLAYLDSIGRDLPAAPVGHAFALTHGLNADRLGLLLAETQERFTAVRTTMH